MKILIVNTFYYPNILGGAENSVKLLAEALSRNGDEVAICSIDSKVKKIIMFEMINNVKVYRIKTSGFNISARINGTKSKLKKISNKLIELNNFAMKKAFQQIINEFQPDVIHTNNLYGLSPYVWSIAKNNNIKIIHTLRDYWMISPSLNYEKNKRYFFYRAYFRYYSRLVDVVTAPSTFTLNAFQDLNYFKNSEFRHINNAVNFDIENTKRIISEKEKLNAEKVNFIFVGNLNTEKGLDRLLKIFIANKNTQITLSICGSGILEDLVKEYAFKDKRIKYNGQLKKEQLNEEFLKADVLIIPSVWEEPFGRVIIEANAFGVPAIGRNRGGISEVIKTIKCGEIFDKDDELKELIKYFSKRQNIKKYYSNIIENLSKYSIDLQLKVFKNAYGNEKIQMEKNINIK